MSHRYYASLEHYVMKTLLPNCYKLVLCLFDISNTVAVCQRANMKISMSNLREQTSRFHALICFIIVYEQYLNRIY